MRLIDADVFKSYIDCGHLRPPTETCFSELEVVRMIDKQPAIDAEPVRHGRWIETRNDEGRLIGIVCNQCHNADNPSCIPGRYCWFCGAKMDGGADNGQNTIGDSP